MDQLPKKDQEVLQAILAKQDPAILTQFEIAFLNARRSYLTPEHRRIFAPVLADQAQTTTEAVTEPVQPQDQTQTQYTNESGQPVSQPVEPQAGAEQTAEVKTENPYDVDPTKLDGSQ